MRFMKYSPSPWNFGERPRRRKKAPNRQRRMPFFRNAQRMNAGFSPKTNPAAGTARTIRFPARRAAFSQKKIRSFIAPAMRTSQPEKPEESFSHAIDTDPGRRNRRSSSQTMDSASSCSVMSGKRRDCMRRSAPFTARIRFRREKPCAFSKRSISAAPSSSSLHVRGIKTFRRNFPSRMSAAQSPSG